MASPNQTSTIKVLEKVQETVACSVCLMPFTDPKLLSCHHEFCKTCLEKIAKKQQDTITISCPQCRSETSLPPGEEIQSLKSAHHLQKILDLETDLKKQVQEEVTYFACASHENERVSLFCEPCESLICTQCIVQEHKGHSYKDKSEACKKCKEDLDMEQKKATKVVSKIDKLMTAYQEREDEIVAQRDTVEHQITTRISELQEALEAKRSSLISRVQELSTEKLDSLKQSKDEAKELQARLQSCLKDCQSLLDDRSEETVISQTPSCLEVARESSKDCQNINLEPPEEANFSLMADSSSILERIDTFATISTCSVSPRNCQAQGNWLTTSCWVGKPTTIQIHVLDKNSQPCTEGSMNAIEFQISSDKGEEYSGVAKRTKGNQYQLTYTPKSKGYHSLSITIRDHPISGSPFRVAVKSPISSLWVPSHAFTDIDSPSGIALDRTGDVLVVSETKKCITVITQTGKVIRETDEVGTFADITVGNDNSIYAVSAVENKVVKLDTDGSVLETSGSSVELNSPMGIAFNTSNQKLYISNTRSHEIMILDLNLSPHKTIGKEGSGKLQFSSPRGICCDSSGRVIVADSNNNRIQILTADGRFLKTLGQSGDQPGHLKWPLGIAVDDFKRIYVSEGTNNRVSIFGVSGNFLRCFGGEGIMKKPCGLAIDSNCGTVMVCSYGHNLIQIY